MPRLIFKGKNVWCYSHSRSRAAKVELPNVETDRYGQSQANYNYQLVKQDKPG